MAVIKLVEDYSVQQLRKDVRDSLMMTGEQAIALSLYHPGDPDAVPCPECGDDIYNSAEMGCTSCYGTMFSGGVRYALLIWALFSDHQVAEQLGQRGVYRPDQRSIQFEAFPALTEHDVVARVRSWNSDATPAVLEGYYILGAVDQRSLRTGNRFGQSSWDVVAQKAQLSELPQKLHGITTYPILGQVFEESVSLTAAAPTVPASAVIQPDTKVIYFPFVAEPGGPVAGEPSGAPSGGYTYNQVIAAATWTIQHTLGYDPDVTIIVDGEEVEADVDYPDNSVVVISFGVPVSGSARLT